MIALNVKIFIENTKANFFHTVFYRVVNCFCCNVGRSAGGNKRLHQLTNHVLANVCHCVELLLADLARELLLGVAVHDLDVLMQRPQLLEGLVAGDTLQDSDKIKNREKNLQERV